MISTIPHKSWPCLTTAATSWDGILGLAAVESVRLVCVDTTRSSEKVRCAPLQPFLYHFCTLQSHVSSAAVVCVLRVLNYSCAYFPLFGSHMHLLVQFRATGTDI